MLEVVDQRFRLESMGTTSIDKSNLVVIPITFDYINRYSTTEPFFNDQWSIFEWSIWHPACWVNLAWTWILGNCWALFVRKTCVKAEFQAPLYCLYYSLLTPLFFQFSEQQPRWTQRWRSDRPTQWRQCGLTI